MRAKGSTLWTPSVFAHREDGQVVYYLFYSAKIAEGDRRCIGYATSFDWSGGWIADPDPLFCPDGDRWAIDADVSRGQDDVWLTLRNGAWTKDRITALGASRLDFDGPRHVRLHSPPTKLLDNADLEWTHHNSPDDVVLDARDPAAGG